MSDPHHVVSHDPKPHEEGIAINKVILVGVSSLLAFAVCTVAAVIIMNRMESEYQTAGGAPADPAAIVQGKDEIGIVEQIPFDSDRRLPIWKAQMDKRLTSYGWVDRAKGIIHVPVERAMQEVVDQAAAAPPPGGGAKK